MIEVTCSACGVLNRIAESDVPVGARFASCASCKSRVPLPQKASGPIPRIPPPVPGKGPPPIALGPTGSIPPIPVPPAAGNKADIIDLADLPAPRRQSPLGSEPSRPAPRSALADAELPAPKARGQAAVELDDLLAPAPAGGRANDVADLPAPRAPRPVPRGADPMTTADLPAPRGARPSTPPRSMPATDADLPMPKGPGGLSDLPMPKGPGGLTDLPAPRAGGGAVDLPAPKGPSGLADLPMPKAGGGVTGLPTPRGPGGLSDLPTPKNPGTDVAPKGFFDNLPQPARKSAQGPGTDVAPKGFFDNLPQPARKGAQGPGTDVAPKGFFDNLPQPARGGAGSDVAPKGFFDDLPQPARGGAGTDVAPKGFFDDLPGPVNRGLDLGDDPIEPIDLADEPPLDLAAPSGGASANAFDDLDLSAPSAGAKATPVNEEALAAGIKFSPTAKKAATATASIPDKPALPALGKDVDAPLELEEPRERPEIISQRLGPRVKEAAPVNEALLDRQRKRKRRIIGGAVLGLALAGAGGFFFYQRHAAQQERAAKIDDALAAARKAMAADDANRWMRAAAKAGEVLEVDPKHGEALALSAEASLAGAIADGKNAAGRIAKGRKQIGDALAISALTPTLERAQALAAITTNPAAAPAKVKALQARDKDPMIAVYLGWAHEAAGEYEAAAGAYAPAIAARPGIKVLALLGRARAKLALVDLDGARADFQAVLEVDKNNVPAMVGIAATLPAGQIQQQETDLLAILARKDIATADPRAVIKAWVMAADSARKGGRLDAARERYRKALAVDAKDIAAMTGLAETELRDKKIEAASETITKALTLDKNHAGAQLVAAEIALRQGKLDDASARIDALAARTPPLIAIEQARLLVVKGKLFEQQGDHEAAVTAYTEAAKLAGDLDLTPTMLAVNKLSAMANEAATLGNAAKESALRERADQLLTTLATAAEQDPQLALALGNAYHQAGAPAKAEPWLRRVVQARPEDPDALYQLGRVLRVLDKNDEALSLLEKARKAAPERAEIGLAIARAYEQIGRTADADALFGTLLEAADPSLEVRTNAGMFYVRTGKLAEAGAQGEKILAVDRNHPAGLYLHGEGLLAAGQLELARKEFLAAVDVERSARHLDALARATESISMLKGKDFVALQDTALRSYAAAIEIDPKLFSSHLGSGRLYVERREMSKAVEVLLAAEKLRPGDGQVAYLLGRAYKELGTKEHKKVAVDWLRRANKLEPSAETAYTLGELYADPDVNQERGAIESYAAATRLAVEMEKKTGKRPAWYADALHKLGQLSDAIGDEGTACRAWKQFLGTNPTPGAKVDEVKRKLATSLRGACN